ncbi:hypothetical protein [Hydrogenophaga sp.]|uniref:hypothetical protein n=1 Tax=Hydrogenophaga sp. TaxID=1904254 RepID=UPI002722848A|nr:hypothetical protein [Hydrogenophaga sp.]MDO8903975.1 hypothetical protein [Hydrogenophaga sp.]
MLVISSRGPRNGLADAIRSMRDIPARVLPYAASTALTRTASAIAKTDLPDEMRRVFDRPTRYTLNSLRIQAATRQTLSASIWVKDDAGGGNKPENFLLPGVEGGSRGEKRFERALRYAGLLGAGERVMPGRQIELDANGNIPAALLRSVNAWAKSGAARKAKRTKDSKAANPRGYFLFGKPGARVRGIAQRSGPVVMPLLIFTKQPTYTSRLDFTGVNQRATERIFPAELDRAVNDLLSRRA